VTDMLRNSTKARGGSGKVVHPDRATALRHLNGLIKAGSFVPALNAYRCRHCSIAGRPAVWHVGHRPGFGRSR